MKGTKLAGAVLLVLGILGLVYGGFSYTKEQHKVDVGPVHLQMNEKERVNVPVWAGVASALVGGAMLAFGPRRA